ncbi:MAG: V-type ATP synthase subunit E family protein [Gemmiger sp.]|nr:V-type ATP synthase subunit E family protein [Gemmiger sp.]
MIELDNRAEQFLESIRQEGEQSCAKIQRETTAQVEAALARTREAEKARAEKSLAFESSRAAVQANRALSAAREGARARLSARRAALSAEVFADARAKLAAFAQSPAYAPWLCQRAAALAGKTALGTGITLLARTADLPLLQGHLPAGCTLQADDTITIGGLKATGAALAADDTLDSSLEAQRDWFLQNSGLSITL